MHRPGTRMWNFIRGQTMKERPILFSHQRVRALLSGQQRQTRRIMKSQPLEPGQDNHEGCYGIDVLGNHLQGNRVLSLDNLSHHCPYGQPGDRLWVRETWRGPIVPAEDIVRYQQSPSQFKKADYCQYQADSSIYSADDQEQLGGWQAGIHMPRWASRIDLLITDIRVEKIQDISDDDVMAEGVQVETHFLNNFFTLQSEAGSAKDAYRKQWVTLYGCNSWEANPWVWVIEFKPI
ncbi:hypothetical protein EPYR_01595 [Erwinia pyrifoliae DSM 12163]|nr:hypothetical protein EPYR_01595 [Erwinia pyrifoliae DSM 12163]